MLSKRVALALLGLSFILVCCGHYQKPSAEKRSPSSLAESNVEMRPWEVLAHDGATILPDIFYAEKSQNQQAIPTTVVMDPSTPETQNQEAQNLQRPQKILYAIDRLIYPTIGNPALFIQSQPDQELQIVLRIEKAQMQRLLDQKVLIPQKIVKLNEMNFDQDLQLGVSPFTLPLHFFLIKKSARNLLETSSMLTPAFGNLKNYQKDQEIFEIVPDRIRMRVIPDAPEVFQERQTLILTFNQSALKNVSEGLYDLRFELYLGPSASEESHSQNLHEFQYNGVRIFATPPVNDEYSILNVTDTQVTTAPSMRFANMTLLKFKKFARFINLSFEKKENAPSEYEYTDQAHEMIRKTKFIIFNGDLHNCGSPLSLGVMHMSRMYNYESTVIMEILRDLPLPIFLTPGNHDGHVSMGHPPFFTARMNLSGLRKSIYAARRYRDEDEESINEAWNKFRNYFYQTRGRPGGYALDIQQGEFIRRVPQEMAQMQQLAGREMGSMKSWVKVAEEQQNYPLYDGFNQWRKSYGPLYASWTFGRNHYISFNSFDNRQHHRTGWGIMVPNYGGHLSSFQMDWINREIQRAGERQSDTILLAHHDPRGGHYGQDFPYLFRQIPYTGIRKPMGSYLKGEYFFPFICRIIPERIRVPSLRYACRHAGLIEWMRPDQEFDCFDDFMDKEKRCDTARADEILDHSQNSFSFFHPGHRYFNFDLLSTLTQENHVRTLVLGHTHAHRVEVYLPGENIIKNGLKPYDELYETLVAMEENGPVRENEQVKESLEVAKQEVKKELQDFVQQSDLSTRTDPATPVARWNFQMKNHELAVIRTASVSEIVEQKEMKTGYYAIGFSIFQIRKDQSAVPRIQDINFFVDRPSRRQETAYTLVGEFTLPRSQEQMLKVENRHRMLNHLFMAK